MSALVLRAVRASLALIVVLASACARDGFVCGAGGSEDEPGRCDRPGERCVCAVNRCARQDPACGSGWRFAFDDGDGATCVPEDQAATALDQHGDQTVCGAAPPEAVPDAGASEASP